MDTIYVNQRGAAENMVAGDIIDGVVIDAAVSVLKKASVKPLVGQFYVLDLPLEGWQILMMKSGNWLSLSPGGVASHVFQPVIAVYDQKLDESVHETQGHYGTIKIGEGFLRGDGGCVRMVFAVP